MGASELVLTFLALLEKAAVLATAAFILSLVQPFTRVVTAHWSVRRTGALIVIFSVISISGSHLNVAIGDLRPDLRAIGILVAGFIGGSRVGAIVGLTGGSWFAFVVRDGHQLWPFFLSASVIDGILAGWIGKRRTIDQLPLGVAFVHSAAIQAIHLGLLGGILAITKPEFLVDVSSRLLQVAPEVVGNAAGVTLFVGILRTAVQSTARLVALTEQEAALTRQEAALTKQEAAATQARLKALQAQIRPHFLYNTLNTIAYLVRTKPDDARALVARLADFYRQTLRDDLAEVPLDHELETIDNYLVIERARMGDRLTVTVDATDAARAAPIPPLLLQPLVENAVQHGISPKPEGGTITVDARVEGGALVVVICDDGVGFNGEPLGTGLSNVAARVTERTPPGTFEIGAGSGAGPDAEAGAQGAGTRVTVALPI